MIQKEKNVQNYDCAFFFFVEKNTMNLNISNNLSNFDWYLYIGLKLFCGLCYLFATFQKIVCTILNFQVVDCFVQLVFIILVWK